MPNLYCDSCGACWSDVDADSNGLSDLDFCPICAEEGYDGWLMYDE